MPPKKAAPTKKDDKVQNHSLNIFINHIYIFFIIKQEDLTDPIPKQECQFKIIFETKQEGGHYFKIKYDWINVSGETIDYQRHDTGFFRDWTLIKIEGEEPKPVEQESPQKGGGPGGPAAKKAPAPAKPDPKKAGALEEITDNRPR